MLRRLWRQILFIGTHVSWWHLWILSWDLREDVRRLIINARIYFWITQNVVWKITEKNWVPPATISEQVSWQGYLCSATTDIYIILLPVGNVMVKFCTKSFCFYCLFFVLFTSLQQLFYPVLIQFVQFLLIKANTIQLYICEGSQVISCPQGYHKTSSTHSWTLSQETSCCYFALLARDCQVAGSNSGTRG